MSKLFMSKLFRECSGLLSVALLLSTTLLSGALLQACSGGGSDGEGAPGLSIDSGVAYVKRSIPLDADGVVLGDDVREPFEFIPGAALYIRNRLSADSTEHNITARLFPANEDGTPAQYDVKDVAVSYDGTKVLFSVRAPEIENADDSEQPTWDIYVYDIANDNLRRLTGDATDVTRPDFGGQDIAPHYLRDGSIVFSSTRQKRGQELLLDEGKPPYPAQTEAGTGAAVNLHVMDENGGDIRQITFNQSHDLDPFPLADGRIVFTRWDNIGGLNRMSLYTINPDGTQLSLLYGYHSHDTGPNGSTVQFVRPVQAQNGQIVAVARPFRADFFGGDLYAINASTHSDIGMLLDGTVDANAEGQAQLVVRDIRVDEELSPGGRFMSAFPLYDDSGRFLVGWQQCLLEDADGLDYPCTDENLARAVDDPITGAPGELQPVEPRYGLWLLDPADATLRPLLIEAGVIVSEAVALAARPAPAVMINTTVGNTDIDDCACRDSLAACARPLDEDALAEHTGILDIRSVYDLDGADASGVGIGVLRDPMQTLAAERPVRFIRLEKPVSMPDNDVYDFDNSAFGASNVMREILGYGVVEPDGSVKLRVPSDVAFTFTLLDSNGRRVESIPRHNNWLQVKSGETVVCHGCHTGTSEIPHGRLDAERVSVYAGAPNSGMPFPNAEGALDAQQCESMAETWGRHDGVPNPSPDLLFTDIWTDPGVRAKDADIAVRYVDLEVEATAEETDAGLSDAQIQASRTPVAIDCLNPDAWNSGCRTVINYEQHIAPLWSRTRQITDGMGGVILDQTCTLCHNRVDANGNPQLPASQLELTAEDSSAEPLQMNSFRELLFGDNEVELVVDPDTNAASVQDVLIDVPRVDANGNPVLDQNGIQIIDQVPVAVTSPMSAAGANASTRFFDTLETTSTVDVHYQALSAVELKLISEWLDIGAQYFNNPFLAPEN